MPWLPLLPICERQLEVDCCGLTSVDGSRDTVTKGLLAVKCEEFGPVRRQSLNFLGVFWEAKTMSAQPRRTLAVRPWALYSEQLLRCLQSIFASSSIWVTRPTSDNQKRCVWCASTRDPVVILIDRAGLGSVGRPVFLLTELVSSASSRKNLSDTGGVGGNIMLVSRAPHGCSCARGG